MSNVFFTADSHFGHFNILRYQNRPYKSAEEMDEGLISNWNSVVSKNDIVYHLGDFTFGSVKKYTDRLNGNINLIIGNHDNLEQCHGHFCSIHASMTAKIGSEKIFLSHFAHRVWDRSHYNVPSLYGHSHGHLPAYGKSFDCGVDTHNYFPYSWEEVKAVLDTLPDNPNLIEKRY